MMTPISGGTPGPSISTTASFIYCIKYCTAVTRDREAINYEKVSTTLCWETDTWR